MGDFGSLSQCVLESSLREARLAKQLRSRALLASTCLEAIGLSILLLWPLLDPAKLPSQPILAPVPIFHSARGTEPVPPRVAEHRPVRRPLAGMTILQQPPRIPVHIAAGDNSAAPVPNEPLGPAVLIGPGAGIEGNEVTEIARPEPSPHTNRPIHKSGGVMEALLVDRVEPDYPKIAIAMHLTGTVELRAVIGTDGAVKNIEVASGNTILANAAVAAVKQWRYQPTRLSGQAVEVETVITVQFQIP